MEIKNMRIGFIGLGVMGVPIAQHVLQAGYTVNGFTRTKEKAAPLLEEGLIWQNAPKDVVENSDIVFTMVGFPDELESVFFSDDSGLFSTVSPGKIFIDMTTSTPQLAKRIAQHAEMLNCQALDAPVTGGDIGAINGTLSMMVGGNEDLFIQVKPLLDVFTSSCLYVGTSGSGQHTKMANQIAIVANLIGMAESFTYSNLMGLDIQNTYTVLANGSATSWQLQVNGKNVIEDNFNPGFYLKHLAKDLTIALDELARIDKTLPMLDYGRNICQSLVEDGYGAFGTQIIIKAYDDLLEN